jgi:hypothetical protein
MGTMDHHSKSQRVLAFVIQSPRSLAARNTVACQGDWQRVSSMLVQSTGGHDTPRGLKETLRIALFFFTRVRYLNPHRLSTPRIFISGHVNVTSHCVVVDDGMDRHCNYESHTDETGPSSHFVVCITLSLAVEVSHPSAAAKRGCCRYIPRRSQQESL